MSEAWTDPDDGVLARGIFGTDDRDLVCGMIAAWANEQGFGRSRARAIELSVGAAVTIALPQDETLFVKVWPGSVGVRALGAQMAVQRDMSARGFPAPAVLTRPLALGPGWAVAMAYDRSGIPTDATRPVVRRAMAAGLARLVSEAEDFRTLDGLPSRSLPAEGTIWPTPHNALFDFAKTGWGAEWIDAIASDAIAIMRTGRSRIVVGHCDWSAKNMRMYDGAIATVYDWDSVFLEREAAILGGAAATFPMTWELNVPETPSIDEMAAFVRDYEIARGTAFTGWEIGEIQAGATYALAYKARCEHAIDPGADRLAGSARARLATGRPFRL